MNAAHWHLALNHLPIIIPIVGLLIMVGGIILKSDILKRTAYCIFILGALTAIAAFSTGEEAEEVVERINGIDEAFIEAHEETAEVFSIILYVLGGISLIGLWANWKGESLSNRIVFVTLSLALVGLFYAKQTGTTGGEIRHTEIRTDGTVANPAEDQSDDHEEDDDG